jgi:putative oxidoreductase
MNRWTNTSDLAGAAQSTLRIVAAVLFFVHGAQKLLGWFGGTPPSGGPVPLESPAGVAGVIEVAAGVLLALGLFTRPVAFLVSGEMAVAYFWQHWGQSGSPWWWVNQGEVAMLFCFIWLFFAAAGAGPLSVDAMRAERGLSDAEGLPARTRRWGTVRRKERRQRQTRTTPADRV